MQEDKEKISSPVKPRGNIYEYLKDRCRSLGIPMIRMFNEAGQDRSVVDRWEKVEPKSIQIFRNLEDALDRIEIEIKGDKHE